MPRGLNLFDYEQSRQIERQGFGFYALIAAAARQADTDNMERLTMAFPHVIADLKARYNAPGGELPGDRAPSLVGGDADE